MKNYVIQVQNHALGGRYLEGTRTPKQVKKHGYGFTQELQYAWRFGSQAAAANKARIVAKHMSWPISNLRIDWQREVPQP